MTEILSGKQVAAQVVAENTALCAELKSRDVEPCLAVVRVGQNVDDVYYESSIKKNCEKVGISCRSYVMEEQVSQQELEATLRQVSADPEIHGIFFFSPLPKGFDEAAARACIAPEKDIDSLTKVNAGKIYRDEPGGFAPCTPAAVMEVLRHYNIPIAGKHAVVIGRSQVVGKPLAMLLLAANATVTICHSKTEDLPKVCQSADILVAAVGRARMIGAEHVREGQVVIDVGINSDPKNPGKICGDVDYEAVYEKAAAITPVPGGVGTVTTSVLLKHCLQACVAAAEQQGK